MVNVPRRYVPKNLSNKDKKIIKKELLKSRKQYKKKKYYTRKKIKSFKSKKSQHVFNAIKIYKIKTVKPSKDLVKKTGCSIKTLKKIVNKGRGAYFSSGSRPNQSAESWGLARLASAITGGKSSIVDFNLLKDGCSKNSKALKMALKTIKKSGKKYGTRKVKQVKINGGDKIKVLKCSVEKLNDNNFKLIAGRRKYITSHFNILPNINLEEFQNTIENLQYPSLCIQLARLEDKFLKLTKQIICRIKLKQNCLYSQNLMQKLQKINFQMSEKFMINLNFNNEIINDILNCNMSNLDIFEKYKCN